MRSSFLGGAERVIAPILRKISITVTVHAVGYCVCIYTPPNTSLLAKNHDHGVNGPTTLKA